MTSLKKNFFILLIWLIISLIIIAISSIIVIYKVIDISDKSPYVYGCGILLFLILGFLTGNIKQKKGLINGIIGGLVVTVILVLIQFLGFEAKVTLGLITRYIVFILSSGLGGIFGVNFKPILK